ncbi:hypothetical protein [Roseibium sp.]|uniref:hypothetical protein n=1 Tax=Roseibium sp. TaxID=1936156 RepID=UPI003265FBC9
MSSTCNGHTAPENHPHSYEAMLRLQAKAFDLRNLAYGLSAVLSELSEAPEVGSHPGVSAAETLIELIAAKAADMPDGIERVYLRRAA